MELDVADGRASLATTHLSHASIEETVKWLRQAGTATIDAKIPLEAGALLRRQLRNGIHQLCDMYLQPGQWELKEYKGLLDSNFLLVLKQARADGALEVVTQTAQWLAG